MAARKKTVTFEQGLERLELIAGQMEKSDLPLDELLKLYEEGMKLSIRICDYFDRHIKDNTVYTLRVFTEEGLAFESDFNGKEAQELQLEVKNRKFYRADVYDKTNECVVAISNPIWLGAEKT